MAFQIKIGGEAFEFCTGNGIPINSKVVIDLFPVRNDEGFSSRGGNLQVN